MYLFVCLFIALCGQGLIPVVHCCILSTWNIAWHKKGTRNMGGLKELRLMWAGLGTWSPVLTFSCRKIHSELIYAAEIQSTCKLEMFSVYLLKLNYFENSKHFYLLDTLYIVKKVRVFSFHFVKDKCIRPLAIGSTLHH